MPELPEVETVRRGLAPRLEGARILSVSVNRPDLRFPFPAGFPERLTGATITHAGRRAKYLLFSLSTGETWLSHLGMTGSYRFEDAALPESSRYERPGEDPRHDHFSLGLQHPAHGRLRLIYNDPRRFGFVALIGAGEESPFLDGLGPEPLGNDFNALHLAARFGGRRTPVKAALLDQRTIAGLGNIYASEALWRAHIRPEVMAASLVTKAGKPRARLEGLATGVRKVLLDAIDAGGSTLKDFRAADGSLGRFQHSFAVYDREGAPCLTPGCRGTVRRIVQPRRSSVISPDSQQRTARPPPLCRRRELRARL
jgi:formamidopyrimidine-DNA glycosylase